MLFYQPTYYVSCQLTDLNFSFYNSWPIYVCHSILVIKFCDHLFSPCLFSSFLFVTHCMQMLTYRAFRMLVLMRLRVWMALNKQHWIKLKIIAGTFRGWVCGGCLGGGLSLDHSSWYFGCLSGQLMSWYSYNDVVYNLGSYFLFVIKEQCVM